MGNENHPIFSKFTLDQLEDRGLGSRVYLAQLEAGHTLLRPGFRRKAARLLHLDEAELFLDAEVQA